ncbi:OmpA family protein [Flaviaesturariibacter aridisoli]|uniref:OmpA family protein n=1 Tax=Flaviaesturariibacter aridisoli TaxID=2545761 RepID=A0A4R4E4I0_9BACT|nr:OmpA family protein [Flaviaesturariibacter aridisoli]TCZ74369.1 OmpA family protein [Flaviaesturariibacter aridisoli]
MKKILVTLLAVVCGTAVFAQTQTGAQTQTRSYKRPGSIGFSLFFNDYLTASRIRTTSFNQTTNTKQLAKFREMDPGLAIHYFKGLTNSIDFAGSIGGSTPRIIFADGTRITDPKLQLEADASAQFKLFSERYFFTPYATVGIGASHYDGTFDAIIPAGAGVKFNIFNEAGLFADATYRIPVTNRANNYHFVYRFGFSARLSKKKEEPVPVVVPEPPKDSDADGIIDSLDRCPTVPGIAKYNGCPIPDTDKDGINDEEDQCPNEAGVAKYKGCPIPDTDKDGVNDEEDKCPQVPGLARLQGCPIPDTDNDGINDEEDKCPTLAGVRENNGCPAIKQETIVRMNKNASRIFFVTGKATLQKTSYAALNDVVKLMNEDKDLKVYIEGHTDNVGKDEYNQKLSEDRAASVRTYLLSKGVEESRIQSQGFGETKPIADNKTAAGRAKNRRVVMRPSYE